jgi:hypothetical protein
MVAIINDIPYPNNYMLRTEKYGNYWFCYNWQTRAAKTSDGGNGLSPKVLSKRTII